MLAEAITVLTVPPQIGSLLPKLQGRKAKSPPNSLPDSHSLLPRSCHFCVTDLRGKTEEGEQAMASEKQRMDRSANNNKISTGSHFAESL